jgi:hypothetical protein
VPLKVRAVLFALGWTGALRQTPFTVFHFRKCLPSTWWCFIATACSQAGMLENNLRFISGNYLEWRVKLSQRQITFFCSDDWWAEQFGTAESAQIDGGDMRRQIGGSNQLLFIASAAESRTSLFGSVLKSPRFPADQHRWHSSVIFIGCFLPPAPLPKGY